MVPAEYPGQRGELPVRAGLAALVGLRGLAALGAAEDFPVVWGAQLEPPPGKMAAVPAAAEARGLAGLWQADHQAWEAHPHLAARRGLVAWAALLAMEAPWAAAMLAWPGQTARPLAVLGNKAVPVDQELLVAEAEVPATRALEARPRPAALRPFLAQAPSLRQGTQHARFKSAARVESMCCTFRARTQESRPSRSL
jgi:hypothetical protein